MTCEGIFCSRREFSQEPDRPLWVCMCPYTYVYACTHRGDLEVSDKLGSHPLSLIHSNNLNSLFGKFSCFVCFKRLLFPLCSYPLQGGPWAWGGIVPCPYSHGSGLPLVSPLLSLGPSCLHSNRHTTVATAEVSSSVILRCPLPGICNPPLLIWAAQPWSLLKNPPTSRGMAMSPIWSLIQVTPSVAST